MTESSWRFVKHGSVVLEQAWVGGVEVVPPPPMPEPAVPHQCRELRDDAYHIDCGVWICPWCERAVPWCYGVDDDAPAICDFCKMKLDGGGQP